jgi:hypothetical protein
MHGKSRGTFVGPWIIALVGGLIVAAGLAIPIKGPGGIGNSRDGDPAPHRSVPAIIAGFVIMTVGIVFAWQPWGKDGASPTAAAVSPTTSAHAAASTRPAAASPTGTVTPDAPQTTDTPTADPQDASGVSNSPSGPSGPGRTLDFTIPSSFYGSSYLDLSKPASGNKLDSSLSALDYSSGYFLESGDDGDVFGYTATKPTSAADCVAQAQEHAITKLETVLSVPPSSDPTIKTNDGFCVSDKGGDVAWLQYVGPAPHDTKGGMELHFKMTLWKQQA